MVKTRPHDDVTSVIAMGIRMKEGRRKGREDEEEERTKWL